MIYRFIFSLLFLLHFTNEIVAQDPTLYISLKLFSKDKTLITEKDTSEYHVLWRIENHDYPESWKYIHKQKSYFFSNEKAYIISDLKQYCKEIIELTIIHNNDSMVVHFKQDSLRKGYNGESKCEWNTAFGLTIPFKKGYYEISELYFEKFWYVNKKTVWINLPPKKRKLIVNDK